MRIQAVLTRNSSRIKYLALVTDSSSPGSAVAKQKNHVSEETMDCCSRRYYRRYRLVPISFYFVLKFRQKEESFQLTEGWVATTQ